jgi:hypothetical protein
MFLGSSLAFLSGFYYENLFLIEIFKSSMIKLIDNVQTINCNKQNNLLSFLPIITCHKKCKSKVAQKVINKNDCLTKSIFSYAFKLCAFTFRRIGQLPLPEKFFLISALKKDLKLFRQAWDDIINRILFFGNNIYHDVDYFVYAFEKQKSILLTPIKSVKEQTEAIKQWNKAI